MVKGKKAKETNNALVLKPHHDRILEAVYQYHFLTADRVVRPLYSPTLLTTVRTTLAQLARPHVADAHELPGYLLQFHEPRPTPLVQLQRYIPYRYVGITDSNSKAIKCRHVSE